MQLLLRHSDDLEGVLWITFREMLATGQTVSESLSATCNLPPFSPCSPLYPSLFPSPFHKFNTMYCHTALTFRESPAPDEPPHVFLAYPTVLPIFYEKLSSVLLKQSIFFIYFFSNTLFIMMYVIKVFASSGFILVFIQQLFMCHLFLFLNGLGQALGI